MTEAADASAQDIAAIAGTLPVKDVDVGDTITPSIVGASATVALTGSGSDLAQSLIKLGKDNLANLHPHPLYASFYYSHPPIVQRVAYLQSHS